MIGSISIIELVEYDLGLGHLFGHMDFAGFQDLRETDAKAKEAVVVLLVSYRKFWKLPLACVLVKGTPRGILAGIIRRCLIRTYDAGVGVWTITMDGTQHNIMDGTQHNCPLFSWIDTAATRSIRHPNWLSSPSLSSGLLCACSAGTSPHDEVNSVNSC